MGDILGRASVFYKHLVKSPFELGGSHRRQQLCADDRNQALLNQVSWNREAFAYGRASVLRGRATVTIRVDRHHGAAAVRAKHHSPKEGRRRSNLALAPMLVPSGINAFAHAAPEFVINDAQLW
ncbi:hypothetical protein [Herbaspirillum camelliae]|uniref:hypothetical protein n=1 Tax=Herbaspirillum camelliae TaxID=1892903 RepID=UPI001E4E725C|nr:hypothetical protein [Herbaspirillum camelliae]